jgi:hypothetical protein
MQEDGQQQEQEQQQPQQQEEAPPIAYPRHYTTPRLRLGPDGPLIFRRLPGDKEPTPEMCRALDEQVRIATAATTAAAAQQQQQQPEEQVDADAAHLMQRAEAQHGRALDAYAASQGGDNFFMPPPLSHHHHDDDDDADMRDFLRGDKFGLGEQYAMLHTVAAMAYGDKDDLLSTRDHDDAVQLFGLADVAYVPAWTAERQLGDLDLDGIVADMDDGPRLDEQLFADAIDAELRAPHAAWATQRVLAGTAEC